MTPSNKGQVEWLFELEADPEVSTNTKIYFGNEKLVRTSHIK